jgi:hypothetical protein
MWSKTRKPCIRARLTNKCRSTRPPLGIVWADWAWVLDVRRSGPGRTAADLRFLGPDVEARQVLVAMDEVLTQAPMRREFIELRTAYLATQDGYRYVSGVGHGFLQQVRGVIGHLIWRFAAGHCRLRPLDPRLLRHRSGRYRGHVALAGLVPPAGPVCRGGEPRLSWPHG